MKNRKMWIGVASHHTTLREALADKGTRMEVLFNPDPQRSAEEIIPEALEEILASTPKGERAWIVEVAMGEVAAQGEGKRENLCPDCGGEHDERHVVVITMGGVPGGVPDLNRNRRSN